ncbi:hypothetical protein RclHR1_12330017 [Rhizophagus clarus]|uniref:DUF5679 domain-containing protein n=1 Tax=Rhizophagus clarus TaxID=94130 RepID=A0A2Z6QZW9_9GLOM|nr:hypothetical protein RclHR1_12330017 [Rhizophagus clarus]
MTEIYCTKCRKKTETSSEVQDMTDNGRYRIHGDCIICGTHKNTLTGENWEVKSHSKREVLDAKKKRKKTATNKKAKKLGFKILDADDKVQAYIKRPTTPPSTSRLESDQEEGIPTPIQGDQEIETPASTQGDGTVSEYFELIKMFAIAQNEDLDDVDIKVKFILGLKLDNAKRAKEFGFEKPLKEIVEHLVG